jgi:hypothetical protein
MQRITEFEVFNVYRGLFVVKESYTLIPSLGRMRDTGGVAPRRSPVIPQSPS